jgi:hypothetical protein
MNTTDFLRVVEVLDAAVGGPDAKVGAHGPFWRGVTCDQFVAKKVFGLALVVLGDGAHSNLVLALKGQSPFGADLDNPPENAKFPRMPAGLDAVPAKSIQAIEDWINDDCPEGPTEEVVSRPPDAGSL